MKVAEAVSQVTERLTNAGLEDPRMESEFLVAGVLRVPRPQLVVKNGVELASEETKRILESTMLREQRQPLAYALGQQPFGDLELTVTPAVLVPRPETEILVEKVLAFMDQATQPLVIADIGTGSGAIALSLARHRNAALVYGVDISQEALDVAQQNAARYDGLGRCQWRRGDLLSALLETDRRPLDLIVANLPYVRREELATLAPEVHHEPRLALDGGPSGLELIFRLIDQAPAFLRPSGMLWLEVGYDQPEVVRQYIDTSSHWASVHLYEDLSGIPRIVCAQRKDH